MHGSLSYLVAQEHIRDRVAAAGHARLAREAAGTRRRAWWPIKLRIHCASGCRAACLALPQATTKES